mgnify:CR=1 FL=1
MSTDRCICLRITSDLIKQRLEIPPGLELIGVMRCPDYRHIDLCVAGAMLPARFATHEREEAQIVHVDSVEALAEALEP